MGAVADWRSFWDSPHSIYVNARHKDIHYRDVADHIVAFVPQPNARVLDYGCGEALHADRVAAVAGEVLLCDAAPSVRSAIAARFAADPRIHTLAPHDVEKLPDHSLDLIVANSMAQYLTTAEFDRLLALWHRLLAPGGILVVGDVVPPGTGALADVIALLRYSAANGFLLAALWGLARTIVSPYRKLRNRIGITRYAQSDFLAKLQASGFRAARLDRNMEHNTARMTFRACPLPVPAG
jgi:SAM-dependent methyltransferase